MLNLMDLNHKFSQGRKIMTTGRLGEKRSLIRINLKARRSRLGAVGKADLTAHKIAKAAQIAKEELLQLGAGCVSGR
jgi:hypothetical protein